MGKEAPKWVRNDDGGRFVVLCATDNLAITSAAFPCNDIHKYTWTLPDGQTRNQIDQLAANSRFKRSVSDTRLYKGAGISSDHNWSLLCNVSLV